MLEDFNLTSANTQDEINGIFHVEKEFENGYYTMPYHFKKTYFHKNDGFNPSLATMSLVLAMSAFAHFPKGKTSKDNGYYEFQDDNARFLLTGEARDPSYEKYPIAPLGFTNFFSNNYYRCKPETDSIGFLCGIKQPSNPQDPVIVAVGIRGSGYESEWAGNFAIAPEYNELHRGFERAADQVVEGMEKYLSDNEAILKNKTVKLWIVGYSRAAATANLTAAKILDYIVDGRNNAYTRLIKNIENVFAYTYETPAGALKERNYPKPPKDALYKKIHNIININDLVTKVAPAVWDYERFGNDFVFPYIGNDNDYNNKLARMLKCMKKYMSVTDTSKVYDIENFEDYTGKGMTMGVFLDYLLHELDKSISPKHNYVDHHQQTLRHLVSFYYNENYSQSVKNIFNITFIGAMYTLACINTKKEKYLKYFVPCVMTFMKNNSEFLCMEDDVTSAGGTIYDFFKGIILLGSNLLSTLLQNGTRFIQGHYPAVCMAWLMSLDTQNYPVEALGDKEQTAETFFTDGTYRIVRIMSTDVTVKNSLGETVAQVTNGVPVEELNTVEFDGKHYIGAVSCGVSEGNTLLYLPPNETYTIKVTTTNDYMLGITAEELSSITSQRLFCQDIINVKSGESYVATINKKTNNESFSCLFQK